MTHESEVTIKPETTTKSRSNDQTGNGRIRRNTRTRSDDQCRHDDQTGSVDQTGSDPKNRKRKLYSRVGAERPRLAASQPRRATGSGTRRVGVVVVSFRRRMRLAAGGVRTRLPGQRAEDAASGQESSVFPGVWTRRAWDGEQRKCFLVICAATSQARSTIGSLFQKSVYNSFSMKNSTQLYSYLVCKFVLGQG